MKQKKKKKKTQYIENVILAQNLMENAYWRLLFH